MRLLVEYILKRWPGREFATRVRLGSPPPVEVPGLSPESIAGLFKPTYPMADGAVYDGSTLYLLEAKIDDETRAMGQLAYYLTLAPRTQGLIRPGIDRTIGLIVLARRIPGLAEFAASLGLQVDYFTPPWLLTFLQQGYRSA